MDGLTQANTIFDIDKTALLQDFNALMTDPSRPYTLSYGTESARKLLDGQKSTVIEIRSNDGKHVFFIDEVQNSNESEPSLWGLFAQTQSTWNAAAMSLIPDWVKASFSDEEKMEINMAYQTAPVVPFLIAFGDKAKEHFKALSLELNK